MKDTSKITNASSEQDGIVFYSEKFPGLGVTSNVMPDGSIRAVPYPVIIKDFLDLWGDGLLKDYTISRRTVVAINLLIIVASIFSRNIWLIYSALFFSVYASRRFYQMIVIFAAVKCGKLKNYGRFHSAEHMAINAYNTLGHVPSLDEIKHYSRFTKYCGSRIPIGECFYRLLMSLIPAIFGAYCTSVFIIVAVILLVVPDEKLMQLYYLNPLQFFVTNKPTDLELNVAIEGLKELERFEVELEKQLKDMMEMVENESSILVIDFC